ncbi:MAG TPA: discoidin domain-containing protein, partial [Polyangiaceae bacterium]
FGDVFANQFNFGSDVHVEGNLMSNASGSLGTGSVIRGNATLTGALGGNRSGVLGRLLEHTSVASQSIFVQPGASLSAVSEAIHNSAPGADAVLPPGDYGDVTIDAGATVQMGPGLYRLHSLTAATDVTLETFANGNATAILVDGQLTLGDRFRTRAASGGVDAKVNIALYTNGTAIQLGHDQFLLGSIESPFGQLVLGNNAFIRDGLSASVLNVGHDATIGSGESTACASSALTPVAATSSSSESATLGPSKAIDGNVATRWSSAASDPQLIALDLRVTRLINRVVLNWEAAFSRSYAIQVAPSASGPWSTIYKTTTGDGGIDDLKGLQGTGRFVRMFSTARGTQFGNSLFEFQVFGDANAACAGFVQLVPTAAVSSSNESSSLTGANAIDADANTRWSSAFSDNQWLYVDLGATRTIKRVVLDWQAAFSSQYDIQVSNAPSVGWTTVYTNNAGDGGVDDLSGLSGQGRYVRMLGRKRATSFGHSLWELQVYGVP